VLVLLALIITWQMYLSGNTQPNIEQPVASTTPAQPETPPPATPEQTQPADQTDQNGQQIQSDQSQPVEPQPDQSQQEPQTEDSQLTEQSSANGTRRVPPGLEAQTELPEDISKWVKEDFLRARQENHPRLLEAVAYLGEKHPGKVSMAQVLTDLLKPLKPSDTSSSSYSSMTTYTTPGFMEAVIYALGKNGSQAARQTLIQVLSGKFATEDDRTAVEMVLRTLTQIPSAENDEILLKVLVSPESIRSDSAEATIRSSELRTRAFEYVRLSTSENLRIKLAENLAQKGLESNDPLLEMLLEENPLNLGAQLALYQSEDITNDIRTRLEQSFLNYSSQAIGLTMGIPSGIEGSGAMSSSGTGRMPLLGTRERYPPMSSGMTRPSPMPSEATRDKTTDYETGSHLAKLLWGEPLASLMSDLLGETRSLEKQPQLIVLASTLPLDSIRAAMLKMLKKRSVDGPQSLDAIGWTDNITNDPAMLVLLKMLPRSRTLKAVPLTTGMRQSTSRYPSRRTPSDMGGAMGQTSKAEAAARKEQTEYDWITTLAKMTHAWCTRFEVAAQAQRKATRRGQKFAENPPTRIDEFEFPQDAKVTAAYQLNWPENVPADLGKVKPGLLKIQYFSLQQSGMIKKTMNNYKRLAKSGDVHELDNGLWLETIKNGSQPNTKRSLDIILTTADNEPVDFTQKEELVDLQADILAVEIIDPASFKE